MTWDDAKDFCKNMAGSLFKPENPDDEFLGILGPFFHSIHRMNSFWLGIKDQITWVLDNGTVKKFPSDTTANSNCLQISAPPFVEMRGKNCSSTSSVICEFRNFSN